MLMQSPGKVKCIVFTGWVTYPNLRMVAFILHMSKGIILIKLIVPMIMMTMIINIHTDAFMPANVRKNTHKHMQQ